MEIRVLTEDIDAAYKDHMQHWWVDTYTTPLALALRRMDYPSARVGYDFFDVGLGSTPLSADAAEYMIKFGYSLYTMLSAHQLAVLKDLHKTSSNHGIDIKVARREPKVEPSFFELSIPDLATVRQHKHESRQQYIG